MVMLHFNSTWFNSAPLAYEERKPCRQKPCWQYVCLYLCLYTPGFHHKISVFSDPALGNLKPLPMNKRVPEQPSPWRKSCKRESCNGDRVCISRPPPVRRVRGRLRAGPAAARTRPAEPTLVYSILVYSSIFLAFIAGYLGVFRPIFSLV